MMKTPLHRKITGVCIKSVIFIDRPPFTIYLSELQNNTQNKECFADLNSQNSYENMQNMKK